MKQGLYSNIAAKRERIAEGSGEKMRKVGSKGAPTAEAFKEAAKTAKSNTAKSDTAKLAKGGSVVDKQQAKVAKVMGEFKEGSLHSGKGGKVVKSPKQAIAIALSEAAVKPKKAK